MGSESQIGEFYRDQSVFITGATGFMGKVLVEKLLRSCGSIKRIYILLRPEKMLDVNCRLQKLLEVTIFDNIRESDPKALLKVVAIAGDITRPGLGISDTDLLALIRDVSIVFHSAATVRFDEPLRTAINLNALGTRKVIELCHKLPKIMCLLHVSTAFSNCNRYNVDERVYPLSVSPQKVIDLCDWMNDQQLSAITPSLLEDRPNTYTYTKAMAETLLADECGSIPTAIVRPSIVIAAWKEPMSGWVDSLNGPTSLIVTIGKGILHHMIGKSKSRSDVIPVDTVINLMIATVWYTAIFKPKHILVYNCTSGSLNPLSLGQGTEMSVYYTRRYPSAQIFGYPELYIKESLFLHRLGVLFEHTIPVYLFDAVMIVLGRKRIMVKVYERAHKSLIAFKWFNTREWNFCNDNILMLNGLLQGVDKENFNFDIRTIDWKTYWLDYWLGIRKYLLKEDDSNLPEARSNLRKIYYLSKFFKLCVVLGVLYTFSSISLLRDNVYTFFHILN